MIKRLILVISLVLMLGNTVYAKPVKTVVAPTYLLANLDDGAILVQENCTTEVMPGDFTKIMTAILSIEKLKLTDSLPFENELSFKNNFGNIAAVKKGYSLTVLQHLQNMLLLYSDASANELAVAHSGSPDAFVDNMNKKAQEIGMKDTVFSSPSGYDPEGISKTTAKDLFTLAQYAYKNQQLIDITSTEIFYLPALSPGGNDRMFSSRNHLISRYTYASYTYSAAKGLMSNVGKDGSSFVAVAEKNDRKLAAIVLNSPDNKSMTVYKDVINLLEEGFNRFKMVKIASEEEIVTQVKVKGCWNGYAVLCTDRTIKALVPIDYDKELVTFEINADESRWAPIKKGEKLGTIRYLYDGEYVAETSLVAVRNENFNIFAIFKNTLFTKFNSVFLFVLVGTVAVFLYLKYSALLKKEKRKNKRQEITGRKN